MKISNLKIGVKLTIISGLGIVMVIAMIAVEAVGSSFVKDAMHMSNRQGVVVSGLAQLEANLRGLQVGWRDIQLAADAGELKTARETFQNYEKATRDAVDFVAQRFVLPANKLLIEQIRAPLDQYASTGLAYAATAEDHYVKTGSTAPPDQIARAKLEVTREKMRTVIAETVTTISSMAENSRQRGVEAEQEAFAAMSSSSTASLAAGAVAILVLVGSVFFGIFTIARPLRNLVGPLERIAAGDFKGIIPGVGRKDEVGQISSAVDSMAQRVSATILEIKASGREVTNASAEISVATTDLSQRTEEQAASLEETSAAMEELSATVKKNAENAQQASSSALTTQDVAQRGGNVVSQVVDAMSRIEDSSRKISDIIGVIDEIARQTNLLALNAAVEAARAGEAGRGFAVVASEVRSLAQRSSQAAKDIKDLITNSNGQVQEGVELVSRAGESLSEIVASIKNVAAIVSEIANASIEQATGLEQINKALSQMDEVTQQNSALVEENAATAKTLENQAKAMDDQVAFFKIDDHGGLKMAVGDGLIQPAPHAISRARSWSVPAFQAQHLAAAEAKPKRPGGSPVRRMQANLATAFKTDEWQEF